jgi:hypothetical protein
LGLIRATWWRTRTLPKLSDFRWTDIESPPEYTKLGDEHFSDTETGQSAGSPHHWIEEGTDEDFRRNVIESDLSFLTFAMMGTHTIAGFGVRSGRGRVDGANLTTLGRVDNPCAEFELTGTYIPGAPMWRALQGAVDRDVHVHDLAGVKTDLLRMLMARPELKLCQKTA